MAVSSPSIFANFHDLNVRFREKRTLGDQRKRLYGDLHIILIASPRYQKKGYLYAARREALLR